MVEKNSILDRTGQTWKLNVLYVGCCLALGLGLAGIVMKGLVPEAQHGAFMLVVGTISALSIVFPTLAIRCPTCGARWLLRALKSRRGEDLPRLMRRTLCPDCGTDGQSRSGKAV